MGGDPASYDIQISALQRENATLLSQKDIAKTSDERSPLVAQAEAALASARAVYSESHPDVVLAKQRLAEARELAKQNLEKIAASKGWTSRSLTIMRRSPLAICEAASASSSELTALGAGARPSRRAAG